MKMYEGLDLIRELSIAFGPSGCEDGVREFIKSQVRPTCDGVAEDRAGNLIVKVKGRGLDYDPEHPRRMMVAAHMDEVGFMVKELTQDGYVKFSPIGRMDPRVLCGRHVRLGDETHAVKGVIATKAIHMQSAEERTKATPTNKMYMEIGAATAEEAEHLVQIGDFGVFDSDFVLFGKDGKYMKGKALDDRLGCAALIEIIRELHASTCDLAYDVYFTFTCAQEIGISGASVAAYMIRPDVVLLVEATAVNDLPGASPAKRVATVGEGCILSLADRNAMYDTGLIRTIIRFAEESGIKYQIKQGDADATDGGAIQRSMAGVSMASLSLPVRYAHSASCVALQDDYAAMKDLCRTVICQMQP